MSSVANKTSDAANSNSGRVERHKLADRLYHWIMALAVVSLMTTAFLPILGIKFEWVTIHWISGIILALCVAFHMIRALGWQDKWLMIIDARDLSNGVSILKRSLGQASPAPVKPGKYNGLQKLYHLGVAFFILALIGSGILMLMKIDTPFWKRNPYFLDDGDWGLVYTVHGFGAMFMVSMVMIHVYFAIRPDEWHLTRSMFRGWMTRKDYQEHHDASRWQASDKT